MTRDYGLRKFGTKAAKVLLAGTMVVAFTPGMAFAHYDPESSDLVVIGNSGDPLNNGVEVVKDWDGKSIQYKGYAHSDGSHYTSYSLYTKITTDGNGTLTAIDITSGNDTFGGVWGYKGSGVTIDGILPKGVGFTATQGTDGAWIPVLSGADSYGVTLSSVTLMSVNADGTADARGIDQNFDGSRTVQSGRTKVALPHYTETTVAAVDGKVTIPATANVVTQANTTETADIEDAGYYNLVKCTYTFGTEANTDKTKFNTYFMTGGAYEQAADTFLDNIAKTTYDEAPESGYTTNRDGWTSVMGTMALRQLGSWGAYLRDNKASTGDLDGEIAAVDTVSGATKTSVPFVGALEAAKNAGYITDVSENVQLTIDGENAADAASRPGLTVNNDAANNSFQDVVNVTKGADGLYTVTGSFNKTQKGGRLSLDAIWLMDMKDQKLGTQGMMALAKEIVNRESNPFAANLLAGYYAANFNITGEPHLIGYGTRTEGLTSVTSFTVSNTESVELDPNMVDFSYEKTSDSGIEYTMKVKDPNITHVVMTYTLGHAKASSAYDLAEQEKVPGVSALLAAATADDAATLDAARKAYGALSYDVKPYTTGISHLEAEEAKWVTALVNALPANTNKNAATAAKAAYDLLDAAAKAQVDPATVTALDKAVAAEQKANRKANTLKLASSKATVKYSKVKKAKQTVSIKAKNAKGTVTYSVKSAAAKKKVSVSKKGVVTLKKGAKKGKYVITVKAAGNSSYKAGSKTFTITVK